MRVLHKPTSEEITTDEKGFSVLGRITQVANKYNGAKLVFDIKKTRSVHGNLNTVYAAMAVTFKKANNQFRILP
jgi:hypothetical protein